MNKFFNTKYQKFLSLTLLLCLAALVIIGCKKKEKSDNKIVEIETQETDHVWYYFTQDGFAQIDNPKNVPLTGSVPYTEAIRISSANNGATSTDGTVKAYALANRLGVICFEEDKISIAKRGVL